MTNGSSPNCPKCGGSEGQLLSSKDGYLNDPPAEGERPIWTAMIYLCACGETFERVVKHAKGNEIAAGLGLGTGGPA